MTLKDSNFIGRMIGKAGLFILIFTAFSCATTDKSGMLGEDELLLTRKYVGDFVDFRYTGPESFGGPHIVWIKTTQDSVYGKISAYSKKCDFSQGDRLYIRRVYQAPDMIGYWRYQIENDGEQKVCYEISAFQHDSKELAQNWF